MVKLSEKEIRVLEAALNSGTYKAAAKSIDMNYNTYLTYLNRIREKVMQAKRFLTRMKRYNSILRKRYKYEEENI